MTSAIKKWMRRHRRRNSSSLELPGAEVRRIKDGLLVTYDLDPSMLTGSTGKNSFNISLAEIVPKAFYKFHHVNSITITASASFEDIRGRGQGRGDVLQATFSRANAK